MSDNRELKIGIVGYGFAGQIHNDAINAVNLPDLKTRVMGIVDPSVTARNLAQIHNLEVYSDTPELLLAQSPDILIVAVPPACVLGVVNQIVAAEHRPQAVLMEKPLAISLNDAREVASKLTEKQIFASVGYTGFYHSEYVAAYELIRSGKIGLPKRIVEQIHIGMSNFPTQYMEENMGGVVALNGGHSVQHLCSYTNTNPKQWRVIDASTANIFFKTPRSDTGTARLVNDDDKIHAHFSWQWTPYDVSGCNASTVYGTTGAVQVHGFSGYQKLGEPKEKFVAVHPDSATFDERHLAGFKAQWQAFVRAVLNGETPPVPLDYALGIQGLLEQITHFQGND